MSYNAILRHPKIITGGLFLFSAAIDLKLVDYASRLTFLDAITKIADGKLIGVGRNPYKYPVFPKFGAMELGDIVWENTQLAKNKKIDHPVFAAHLIDDTVTPVQGILDLVNNHCNNGIAFLMKTNIVHGELPLKKDIALDYNQNIGPLEIPKANPEFGLMMQLALQFFRNKVV